MPALGCVGTAALHSHDAVACASVIRLCCTVQESTDFIIGKPERPVHGSLRMLCRGIYPVHLVNAGLRRKAPAELRGQQLPYTDRIIVFIQAVLVWPPTDQASGILRIWHACARPDHVVDIVI